jgi:EamA domain-containing membrane protein RarD
MKKISLTITLLWGVFPFVVKATEKQGSVDWLWFTIIWLVMGISICCSTYLFYTIERYQQEEMEDIEQIRETLKRYS